MRHVLVTIERDCMGRLTRSHVIEAVIWLSIVAIFFAFSYEFDRPIEIYKFGATAWPRVVIFLLLIAIIGNLYYQYKHGSDVQDRRIGVPDASDDQTDFSDPSTLIRILAVLFTPFLFAVLLKPVGIYFSAPFFIALIIWLFGERRWKAILIMTVVIYFVFITLFLVILNAPLPQGNTSPFYDFSAWILTLNARLQGL